MVVDALVAANRTRIITFALAARLPAIFNTGAYIVEAGGLMSYGPNFPDLYRRTADYVDRILRGTKPADLPVEQPTKFDLVINLTTAKALGLDVPAFAARPRRRGDRMKRREFITLLGGAAARGRSRRGRSRPSAMRRIGVLTAMSETDPTLPPRMAAFQKGLQAFGWAEGRNVSIVYRHATSDLDRLKSAALELVAAAPELIVVWSNPAVIAMRAVDRSIPVVFVSVGDPVGSGFVESLGRPGGNLTGFTAFEPEMGGKWLEHLKEVAPALTRAMVLLHPDIAANFEFYRAAQAAGTALKINVDAVDVRGAADIQRAVSALAGEPHAGVLVLPNPASASHRDLIIGLASRLRLPAIYPFRYYALDGGLISYGPDTLDLFRRAAGYVDRILKGDPPASLPVQTPVKFELVINLKTAKALGLDVPPTLLARADEVIE